MRMNFPRFKQIARVALLFIGVVLTNVVWAAVGATQPQGPSLGMMAQNTLEPVSAIAQLLYTIFYVIGGMMIAGSGIQYKAYRDNPSQVPINRPVFLLIIGLIFIALPLVCKLSEASWTVG